MTIEFPGGRRLLLAGGEWVLAWLAAGGVAVALLAWLYREERRLVSRRTGLGLLALRLLAAVALVATLFEPIAATSVRETVRGRVIVAADVSESMRIADAGRTRAERERLARTLPLGPGEAPGALSRLEIARCLIDGPGAPLARLTGEHDVEGFAFGRDASPAALESLARMLRDARHREPGDPSASATDWLPVLGEALKGGDENPVLGVVLLTDGRRNTGDDPGPVLDRLAARGVPVFPVLIGSTHPPRDAAVARLKVPDTVYKGDTATIEAVLKLDGYEGRDVAVTLDRPGAEPIRQVVRATGGGTRPTVAFRVPLEEAGRVPLTVALEGLEGDAVPENDRRSAVVHVADDQARVLLVDAEARWEFRYLRNALARDPRVRLDAVILHPPTASGGTYASTFPGADATPAEAEPADPLAAYDVVVLGDLGADDISPDDWRRLDGFVSRRGGTLVLGPGPRGWSRLADEMPKGLLPVLDPRPVPVDPTSTNDSQPALPPGTPFRPTDEAIDDPLAWPMLQLGGDAEESRRRWEGLPPLPWAIGGRAKPGATVLATAGDDAATALLAAQPYGLGKVLWVGTDGTWRWRHRVGDAYHHRFWGQIVRWATSGRLAAGNALVRFGPLRPRVAEREPVRIQARIGEGVVGIGPETLLAARVIPAGEGGPAAGAPAVVPLRPVAGLPRTFEGEAPGLPAGTYAIRLDAPGLAGALGLAPPGDGEPPEAALDVVTGDGDELIELAAARDQLDPLAAATAGRVFAEDEAGALPAAIRARVRPRVRLRETPLWDAPPALLLFLAILTVEWVARKRAGLP